MYGLINSHSEETVANSVVSIFGRVELLLVTRSENANVSFIDAVCVYVLRWFACSNVSLISLTRCGFKWLVCLHGRALMEV